MLLLDWRTDLGEISVIYIINGQAVAKFKINISNINKRLSIYDYFNLFPIEYRFANSASLIQTVSYGQYFYLNYLVSPNKNLQFLFHYYVNYYNIRTILKAEITKIKLPDDYNHLICNKNDTSKEINKEDKKMYLEDLKLMIVLFTCVSFFISRQARDKDLNEAELIYLKLWNRLIQYAKKSIHYTVSKKSDIYKVSKFSIVYFLFSLFINIYVNKFNEKDVKEFSVTNQLYNKKLYMNRIYNKEDNFNCYIHNLQLPITITQFAVVRATFLMMIVHLLPYLKDIDKISPIIDYLLPKLRIEHEEQYYMLHVLIIIIQKRTLEQQQPELKKTEIKLINKLKDFIRKYSIHKYNVLLIIGYDSDYLIKKQRAQIIFHPIIKDLVQDEYNGNNPYLN